MASVVQIVERLTPGGLETLALDLATRLGPETRLFSLQGHKDQLVQEWPRLENFAEIVDGFSRKPGLDLKLILSLARRLRQLRPIGVIVHHIGPLLYGGVAARLSGIKTIIHVEHDAWHYSDRGHRAILRFAIHTIRPKRVAVSLHVATATVGVARSLAPLVISPGIDLSRFCGGDRKTARVRLGLGEDAIIVGAVGRLVSVKGHETLVRALPALPKNLHLVLVGDGPLRERLHSIATCIGVEGQLHMIGHIDSIEMILPAFDVFCLPSHNEGLPRVLLEAQAADLPVVASAVGGVPEAVCPTTGVLIPPGDPTVLARALRQVLASPRQAGIAREFIKTRFGLDSTVDAFRRLLHE